VIFNFSGRAIDFVVPDGIEQVELDIYGAAGGDTTGNPQSTDNLGEGGFGAGVQNATLAVTPGATLTVIVGGEGGPADSPAGGSGTASG
jgi:trimeric autotransporter adhesin